MKLQTKTFGIIVLTTLCLIASLHLVASNILSSSYGQLESTDVTHTVELVNTTVYTHELTQLRSSAFDWAFWNDSYNFVQTNSSDFVQANLVSSSFVGLQVNYILYVNSTNGGLIYGSGYDLVNAVPMPVPASLKAAISADSKIWSFGGNLSASTDGAISVAGQPVLFVSDPVLQDISGQPAGPIKGDVIFARDVDQQYLHQASVYLALPLNMTLYSSWQASSSGAGTYTSPLPSVYMHPLNGSYILGDDVVRDIGGHPVFVIGAILPRTMYQAGATTLNFIDASLLVASVAFGGAMVLLMQTVVLSRLRKLDDDVKRIGGQGGAAKLEVKGDDSISSLGRSINDMLGEIETKSTRLRESERFAAIGELATMVAHDLRNPLQGIANAAFYLKRSRSSSPKDEQMLTLIQDDVKYSDKIVSDLLDYSRSSTLELSETNPRSLMKQTLPMIPLPQNIVVQDETKDGPAFKVDLDRMKRVIINIVNNAADAMPNGGSLTLGSKENGKTVDLTFTDTGTGMTQEVLGKLFQPLYTTKAKGMGLGLSICKRIVGEHGGAISVQSTPGRGTTFTITLPIVREEMKVTPLTV